MKKLITLGILTLITACSLDQKPAPYEVYGTKYYGKNTTHKSSGSHPVYHDDEDVPATATDYNSRIDQHNSNAIVARPLSYNQPSKFQNSVNTQVANSNGITSHPLAIDGNEEVVKVGSGKTLIHSGASSGNDIESRKMDFAQAEETVPPVNAKEDYVNPSEKNEQRNAEEKLERIKPLVKPAYAPAKVATADKPKIVAKIKNIETSSGNAPKNTIGVAKVEEDTADDQEDVADAPAIKAEAENLKLPVKPIPVEAGRVVDNKAAENKRETEIAAQKAVAVAPVAKVAPKQMAKLEEPKEMVAPVEEKAEPEVAELKAPTIKSQFIKPVDGAVVAEFGGDGAKGFNDGINIQAPEGTPVKASSGGTIVYSGNQLQGYGNMVIIKHNNGFLTAYSHLKELEVKKGSAVGQGDVIGHVGKTGNVNNPQLHFGIRKGREPVDPKDYL